MMDWHDNIVEDDDEIRELIKTSHVIAVVGIKDETHAQEAAHSVPAYLHSRGYRIIPVNPNYKSVFGIPCVASLDDVNEPVDIVQVFRAPKNVMPHALAAVKMQPRPRAFWMQTGIRHQEAAHKLAAAGIKVVQDHCIYMDHLRFVRVAA